MEDRKVGCFQEQSEQDLPISSRHCEERSDAAIQPMKETSIVAFLQTPFRHSELDSESHSRRVKYEPSTVTTMRLRIPSRVAQRFRNDEKKITTFPLERGKAAFTLAEVLITLGIIGVVAAMTMPVIMGNYRKKVTETRLAKFYTIMNQAIQRSEVDNGPQEFWEFPAASSSRLDFYNKYLAKYINTTKVVTNSDLNTQSASPIIVYFADGSAAVFGTTWLFYPEAKNLKLKKFGENEDIVYVDTETSGRDWFTFVFNPSSRNNYYKKGMEPYVSGWDGTKETLYNHSLFGCKKQLSGTQERAYCAKLIQMNGWKIPDNYPVKF